MQELTKQINLLWKIKNKLQQELSENKKEELETEIDNYNKTYNTNYSLEDKNLLSNIWKDLEKIAKQRWEFFQNKKKLTNYVNFSEEYKKVAQTLWIIKAYIIALEKEKIDAKKLTHWTLMLEKDKQHYLLFIPRENFFPKGKEKKPIKNYIEDLKSNKNGNWTLYKFESLTLKALKKLCFGKENNTFRWWIYQEAQNHKKLLNNKWKLKQLYEIENEKELINFYQTILKLNSTRRQIKLHYFNEEQLNKILEKDIETLEELEVELKKFVM